MADTRDQNAEAKSSGNLEPESSEQRTMPDEEIDETLEETFPASDPPQWTLGVDPHPQTKEDEDSK